MACRTPRVHVLDGAESIGGTKLLLEDEGVRLLDSDHVVIYERYSREFYKKFPGDEHGPYVRAHVAAYGKEGGEQLNERAVMLLYDGDLPLLTRIKPRPGSKYVRSSWEPFNDEQKPDHNRLKNWCDRFGMSYHHIHASGHVYGAQLKEAIRVMRPRRVVFEVSAGQ